MYKNNELESFLKVVWQRANTYQEIGNKRREARLRRFYKHVLIKYREKKSINKNNYVNL